MRLPNFIIIGAAKSGTTSLHAILDQHPQIFMPSEKEPEYFARDDRFALGLDHYKQNFLEARDDQLIGEASTIYSLAPHFPNAAKRMKAQIPDVKIIYVMREPVSRAYSYYLQLVKNYQNVTGDLAINRTFEEFVTPELHAKAATREHVLSAANSHLPDVPELCLSGSEYVTQINAYLEEFDREQMLFLTFEEFVANQRETLRKITEFLQVEPVDDRVFSNAKSTQNVSSRHFDRKHSTATAQKISGALGPIWRLRHILPTSVRKRILDILARRGKPVSPKPMESATKSRLQTRFKAQFPELRRITGLDLKAWEVGDQ